MHTRLCTLHNGRMGRTGHPARLLIGAAAVAVAAGGVVAVLTRAQLPLTQAATHIAAAVDASVVAPDGTVTRAVDGHRLLAGDSVRTGAHGSVELLTRSRRVYVGPAAVVVVLDGARQQLRTGGVVVDAQQGSGMRLEIANDIVSVPDGSASEAERSVTVTVGSLAGPTRLTSGSGRQLRVPAYEQVSLDGAALPNVSTPLRLSDDAAEAQAVPTLVSDDLALQTLASGLNSAGSTVASAIDTSWHGRTQPIPAAAGRGEQVLPLVIADATHGDGGAQQRYDRVVSFRAGGGSWGPALHVLGGRAAGVVAELTALQRALPAGEVGAVSTHALAVATRPRATTPRTAGAGGGASGGAGGGSGSHPPASPAPAGPPAAPSSPVPSPSAGSLGQVLSTTDQLVHQVLTLLPLPQPSSSGGLSGLLGQ